MPVSDTCVWRIPEQLALHISKYIDGYRNTNLVGMLVNINQGVLKIVVIVSLCLHITNFVTSTADHQMTSKYTEISTVSSLTSGPSFTETISFE